MKKLILHIALFFSWICFSQNEQLAQYYYEKGDFEKAKLGYEELLKGSPQNSQYFQRTVDCYQQLQQYDLAEKTIQNRLSRYKQGFLLVDLGYNYQDLNKDFCWLILAIIINFKKMKLKPKTTTNKHSKALKAIQMKSME